MKETKKHKAEILLISGLFLIGAALALALLLTRQEGTSVEVRVSGQVVERFALTDSVQYEIPGADGGGNLLVIEDGAAWIREADCPDALCCQMGKIHMVGQSVVCLPHEVVVEVTGQALPEDPDVIAS